MILFDTDHLSVLLDERDARYEQLNARVSAAEESFASSIVNVEEVFRGWLGIIHRLRDAHRQISAYARLGRFLKAMSRCEILPFDDAAADQFTELRRQRIRIGTMDLKIGSIALVNDARLITANTRDFSQIPGLRCENWLPT